MSRGEPFGALGGRPARPRTGRTTTERSASRHHGQAYIRRASVGRPHTLRTSLRPPLHAQGDSYVASLRDRHTDPWPAPLRPTNRPSSSSVTASVGQTVASASADRSRSAARHHVHHSTAGPL